MKEYVGLGKIPASFKILFQNSFKNSFKICKTSFFTVDYEDKP